MRMSCATATIAATAIFHSKKIEIYAAITMRKTISASTALWVMSPPHVGPTFSTDTDDAEV